jgi:Ca-activated chloride channel homolog
MRDPSKPLQPPGRVSVISQAAAILLFTLIMIPSVALPEEFRRLQFPQDKPEIIKINVDLVVLHVTVQDHKRFPVSDLRKEAFQVYEDGILQPIESFSHEDIPATVGLVIDNSGSMSPKRGEVVSSAMRFTRSSNRRDQFFVVNFNEKVSFGLPLNTPFTDNPALLERAMSKIAADGMTALYDAIAAALAHMKRGNQDKQALIVVSDGADNASRHSLPQIIALAKQSEAIIYAIGLYDKDDPDRNPDSLKQLAKATGGEAFFPKSVTDVLPICEIIAQDIRSQYTLSYAPTNAKYDGKYRVVEIKIRAPGRERLKARTRAGYYVSLRPPRT